MLTSCRTAEAVRQLAARPSDHTPQQVGPVGDLLVRSDAKHDIDFGTAWSRGWQKRGWRKGDGKTPENVAIVQAILVSMGARTGRAEFE